MKQLIIIFLCISTSLFSQEIEGISIFKLGKFKESQVDSLAQVYTTTIFNCDNYECDDPIRSKLTIKKLLPNQSETYKSPSRSSYSPNISVYSFMNYKLNEKYNIEKIVLSFYKSILYSIDIISPEKLLIDDLELKYGDGELSKRESKDRCYISGESFELPSTIYTKNWKNTNQNLSMMYMLMSGYSSSCEKRILSSLHLMDKNIYMTADQESNNARNNFKSSMNKMKKENLKDL
ncbi:hypothetical protein GCM10023210_33110 [Chryseobacterium ginsengisoli]|uniref:Uncharacterized protein n=1 Tax=Chryseobacterium ginsengisoli TaxID=363853 RepID=A0ABP9MJV9_9FLAO